MSKREPFRKKRSDTKIGTIEKTYDVDFGVRSDKKLGKYLKKQGHASLSQLLKAKRK
jgi:hypothetical protein